MSCSYPITIRDKLRGTDINPKRILVPCGKCIDCIQRKRSDWSFRLLQEHKNSLKSTFLTLTYNEENLPQNSKLVKKDLQNYFKRVRTSHRNLKYYAVGEYGTQGLRPHYHAIVFNCDNSTLVDQWHNTKGTDKNVLGFVTCDTVTEASIHYVTGYVVSKYGKIDEKTGKSINTWAPDDIKPFAIMSKGLGKIYLKHNTKFHKSNFTTETTKEGGQKQLIPRYYRDQIFDEKEKKILVYELQKKFNRQKDDDDYDPATGELIGNSKKEFQKRKYKKLVIKNQLNKKTI